MTTVSRKNRPHAVTVPKAAPTKPTPRAAQPSPSASVQPLPKTAMPADVAAYAGRDLHITVNEEQCLARGDLKGFWGSRLGKDPVARVGLAMWGSKLDVDASIRKQGLQYWTPDVNIFGAVGLLLRDDLPKDFALQPHKPEEVLGYWTWMGDVTLQRLVDQAVKAGVLAPDASLQQREAFSHAVGLDLAKAHATAVSKDLKDATGAVPGLLSRAQIAAYHHRVFGQHGLPPETYGGTPYKVFPNALELRLAGGLYAPDADKN